MTADLRTRLQASTAKTFVPSPDLDLGYCVKCYDGDTITVVAEVGGRPARLNLRIIGIDTPELRGRGKAETVCARKVQQVLEKIALHKFVSLPNACLDKYGRLLCSPILEGSQQSLTELLLNAGLGRRYEGGERLPFTDAELEQISQAADNMAAS